MNRKTNTVPAAAQSNRLPVRRVSRTPRNTSANAAVPIGTRAQKIASQPMFSESHPPPSVPAIWPAPIAPSVTPSAVPLRSGPNALATMAGPTVKRMATPMPCGTRNATTGASEPCKEMTATDAV